MDMDTILAIVAIIVLLGVAGACAFLALKVKGARDALDAKVGAALDDAKAVTEALKPAVAQAGPLMERVNITLDALDVEVVRLDGKLDEISALTGKVSGVVEGVPRMAKGAKEALKSQLFK